MVLPEGRDLTAALILAGEEGKCLLPLPLAEAMGILSSFPSDLSCVDIGDQGHRSAVRSCNFAFTGECCWCHHLKYSYPNQWPRKGVALLKNLLRR